MQSYAINMWGACGMCSQKQSSQGICCSPEIASIVKKLLARTCSMGPQTSFQAINFWSPQLWKRTQLPASQFVGFSTGHSQKDTSHGSCLKTKQQTLSIKLEGWSWAAKLEPISAHVWSNEKFQAEPPKFHCPSLKCWANKKIKREGN